MCILIQHPANTAFTDELLLDFYQHNPDGFGAVYAENGELVVIKTLGKPDEIKAIYHEVLKGRECIIHYRMKTHGDIDLDNCHPYHVTDDIWMAHNGILSMGNPIDPRRSDTWHFIEYILRPALTANPELLFDVDYQDYIGDMIGTSNKFAFMHSDGRSVIINESAGVNHEGAWLSNTYAWSAAKYGHGFKSKHNYDWYTGKGDTLTYPTKHSSTSLQTWTKHNAIDTGGAAYGAYDYEFDGYEVQPKTKVNYRKALRAAYNCYRRGSHQLLDWVIAAPEKAEFLLLEWYGEMYKNEMSELVNADPEEAVALLKTLFDDGSVNETDLL
jgi:predicted glutamine amidotransferase